MLLEQINQVNDIKKLNKEDWEPLAQEIRDFLIEKISVTGGHLASNLGALVMHLHRGRHPLENAARHSRHPFGDGRHGGGDASG